MEEMNVNKMCSWELKKLTNEKKMAVKRIEHDIKTVKYFKDIDWTNYHPSRTDLCMALNGPFQSNIGFIATMVRMYFPDIPFSTINFYNNMNSSKGLLFGFNSKNFYGMLKETKSSALRMEIYMYGEEASKISCLSKVQLEEIECFLRKTKAIPVYLNGKEKLTKEKIEENWKKQDDFVENIELETELSC